MARIWKRRRKLGESYRFAVVDTETTGLSRSDRIVEFACVTIIDGEIADEYDTLLQPNRDIGPTHIHGLSPSMLEGAPEFEAVAGDIAARLHGAILVAHNISFDLRMLNQEIQRVQAMSFDPGAGICTYKLTRQKLSVAADQAGLDQPDHSALTDARITAKLLLALTDRLSIMDLAPISCQSLSDSKGVTHRRPNAPPRRGSLGMLAARTAWPSKNTEAEALYLDVLDRCLDDTELTPEEQTWLSATAEDLGISEEDRQALHLRYFDRLVEQIRADGVVTTQEQDLHDKVARALMIDSDELTPDPPLQTSFRLEQGMKVVFTGKAVVEGELVSKAKLEESARQAGLQPVKSVSRKCDLVVAADTNSRSGKARRARELNIPIIDVLEFKDRITEEIR